MLSKEYHENNKNKISRHLKTCSSLENNNFEYIPLSSNDIMNIIFENGITKNQLKKYITELQKENIIKKVRFNIDNESNLQIWMRVMTRNGFSCS